MRIRPEQPSDFDTIDEVVRAAFDDRQEEVDLVRNLRESDAYVPELSLVMDDGGEVIGHIMLSYAHVDETRVLSLAPLSVRPDRQNEGIGQALTRAALRVADDMREPLCLVLGHPDYYPRFGFERSRSLNIEPHDSNMPDNVVMAIRLSAYDPHLSGRIIYPPAFDETS